MYCCRNNYDNQQIRGGGLLLPFLAGLVVGPLFINGFGYNHPNQYVQQTPVQQYPPNYYYNPQYYPQYYGYYPY